MKTSTDDYTTLYHAALDAEARMSQAIKAVTGNNQTKYIDARYTEKYNTPEIVKAKANFRSASDALRSSQRA